MQFKTEMIKPDKIIRSKRKSIALQINRYGELIVKAPLTLSERKIFDFIDKYKDWIIEKRNEVLITRSTIKKYFFSEGEEFLFLGKIFKLKVIPDGNSLKRKNSVKLLNEHLIIPELQINKTRKLIEDFYRKEAKRILTERVKYYIEKYSEIFGEKLNYSKIKITRGRSTIASCSAKNNLNFSWKLIQSPIEIIDYVVVHEIVHIKDKHHRKSFWQKVYRLKPDYRENLKWLKENWIYLREFLSID